MKKTRNFIEGCKRFEYKEGNILCFWMGGLESLGLATRALQKVLRSSQRPWPLVTAAGETWPYWEALGPSVTGGQVHSSAFRAFAEQSSSERYRRRLAASSPQMGTLAQPCGDREGLGKPREEE